VRRRPYCVVLLDEVEKAHPEVFNVLLQVLDDGRLTDGQGRTVDFRNTIIVMTSNYGSQQIQELTASGAEDWEIEAAIRELLKRGPAGLTTQEFAKAAGLPDRVARVMARAAETMTGGLFRPELLNRIDEVVVFHQLKREELDSIVEIQLEHLRARLRERQIALELSKDAVAALVAEGYDPMYGARPLKRVIQQRLENPLATRLLSGAFGPGDTIRVTHDHERFDFAKA
jgi:ATP-dependent Clp protease ATP-binding subunit ClpB